MACSLSEQCVYAASEVLKSWQVHLLELKTRYSEDIFTSLVAFCGIQNGLWPLWMKCCAEAEFPLDRSDQVLKLTDPGLHQLPWFCVFNPIDTGVAWVLVRGENLPDSAGVYHDMQHKDVSLTLKTMDETRKPIMYNAAREIFERWGVYDQGLQLESFGTFIMADAPNSNSISPIELRLPVIRCETLLEEWPLWNDGFADLHSILGKCCETRLASGTSSSELRLSFMHLAGTLWSLLQQEGIIHCSDFKIRTAQLFSFLRSKQEQPTFNGILILVGDHQKLWRAVRER